MGNCNYSIIIPHHNIPKLLKRCLQSIPERSDTEIIIIDDNSSPDIVDFDNFPGKERHDTKIIFDKKGGGGGYARNLGLKIAQGRQILFADSDDFFNYCYDDILDEYISNDADMVFFKANSVDTDTYVPTGRADLLNGWINLSHIDENKANMLLRYKFGEPWCKLIKREVIIRNDISFDETPIHNDTHFSYVAGFYAHKIKCDNRALYCVTVRQNSVSKIETSVNGLVRIQIFGHVNMFFKSHNIPLKENGHIAQLTRFYFSDKKAFNEGFAILMEMGYAKSEIRAKILWQIISNFKYRFLFL